MILAFHLSMPRVNSWNGRWSGERKLYVLTRRMRTDAADAQRASELLSRGRHYYSFGDGWTACVVVREVDGKEAARLRRTSAGFNGYDWMVDSLLKHGEIKSASQQTPVKAEV